MERSSMLTWYAVYTRFRYERKICDELNKKGVQNYLPIVKRLKKWSDRNRLVTEPAIPSYIFVCPTGKQFHEVLNISGVINYVNISGKPSPIPPNQIEALRAIEMAEIEHSYTTEKHAAGKMVLVRSGPLKGFVGELIEENGRCNRILIRISQIGYSVIFSGSARNSVGKYYHEL